MYKPYLACESIGIMMKTFLLEILVSNVGYLKLKNGKKKKKKKKKKMNWRNLKHLIDFKEQHLLSNKIMEPLISQMLIFRDAHL